MKRATLFVISLYQKLLSPDHGWMSPLFPYGYCRYYPTCSSYMKDAVRRYGAGKGVARGVLRLARCHPWHTGGIDEA